MRALGERFRARAVVEVKPAQPIPSAANAPTALADDRRYRAFMRRNLLDAYDRVGTRSPRWDAAARRFMEADIDALSELPGAPSFYALTEQGEQVIALGCEDPAVLYLQAWNIANYGPHTYRATALLEKALAGMKTAGYSRGAARLVAATLYGEYAHRGEGVGLRPPLAALEMEWFKQSLTDGSYQAHDEPVVVLQLIHRSGKDLSILVRNGPALLAALESAPWVEPWLRHFVAGHLHWTRAWEIRGHEFASGVGQDQWRGFERECDLARAELAHAWQLRPDRPEAPRDLLCLAGASRHATETPRTWFDRAVAAQLDYLPAYLSMLNYLLPRWGGSHSAMLAFGEECLGTGRFDTGVPLMLLRAVERIADDQDDDADGLTPIYKDPRTFAELSRMLDGYLARTSDPDKRLRFESYRAIVAAKSGRPGAALEQLKKTGFRLEPDYDIVSLPVTADRFMEQVSIQAGPARAAAKEGESALKSGQRETALEAFRRGQALDAEPLSSRYLGRRIEGLSLEQRLAAGGWVPFLPADAPLTGWTSELGSWAWESDGALRGTSDFKGLLITSVARVGADFEIRGATEFVHSTNGEYQAGIAFGDPSFSGMAWASFRIKRNHREGNVAYFSQHFMGPWNVMKSVEVPDRNRFLVRSWHGRVSAVVNGTLLVRDDPLPPEVKLAPDAVVGFGAYVDENEFTVRFRDVELRRLTSEPPSLLP